LRHYIRFITRYLRLQRSRMVAAASRADHIGRRASGVGRLR
jgi:hypothetical protein